MPDTSNSQRAIELDDYVAIPGVDDTTAVQSWIAALIAASANHDNVVGIVRRRYKIKKTSGTDPILHITGWSNNLSIIGIGADVGFDIDATTAISGNFAIRITGGSDNASGTIGVGALNAAYASRTITPTSTTTMPTGAIIRWRATSDASLAAFGIPSGTYNLYEQNMVSKIVSKVGNLLTLADPFPSAFNTGNSTVTTQQVTLNDGFSMENITIRGGGGFHSGIIFTHLRNPRIKGIRTIDMNSTTGGVYVQWYDTIYEGTIEDCYDWNGSGNAGAVAISFISCSNMSIHNIHSAESQSYGVIFTRCSNNTISDVYSNRAWGRGLEFLGSSNNRVTNIVCNHGGAAPSTGATGLSIVYGSSNNVFMNICALSSGNQSVWSNGVGNRHNKYVGVHTYGSSIVSDIAVSPGDVGAEFYGVDSRATISVPPDAFVLAKRHTTGATDPAILYLGGRAQITPDASYTHAQTNVSGLVVIPNDDVAQVSARTTTDDEGGFWVDTNFVYMGTFTATPLSFVVGGATTGQWSINTSGTFQPATTNSRDIGSTTIKVRHGFATNWRSNDATRAFWSDTTLNSHAGASTATLTNAPIPGNPSKWIPYEDNGLIYLIPVWLKP